MEGKREAIAAHMEKLLGDNSLLILPAAPGPAPRLQTPAAQLDGFRTRLISLTCIAGLAKLPQVRFQVFIRSGSERLSSGSLLPDRDRAGSWDDGWLLWWECGGYMVLLIFTACISGLAKRPYALGLLFLPLP